jgi:hypothetical protein
MGIIRSSPYNIITRNPQIMPLCTGGIVGNPIVEQHYA